MARISVSRVMSLLGTLVERKESIPLLERVQPHVAAYARIAENGAASLYDVEDVNEREIADAISLATGDRVRSLTMLSAAAPERPARWRLARLPAQGFPGVEQERANWIGRGIAKDGFLFSRIVDRWNDDIWLDMADTADDLAETLDAELIGPLADALVWGSDVDRMGGAIAGLYRVPMFYAVGFALLGNEKNLGLLLPLLRQLEHVVIVGERRGMRDSWVVLIG